jgi:hypothetical protein
MSAIHIPLADGRCGAIVAGSGRCTRAAHPREPVSEETRRLAALAYGWDGPSQAAITAAKQAVLAERRGILYDGPHEFAPRETDPRSAQQFLNDLERQTGGNPDWRY